MNEPGPLRLSDLLEREVVDEDGRPLGRVADVRLVQDGPYVDGFGALLRVDGMVVARRSVGIRLGFHRRRVKGPWPLKPVLALLARRSLYVPWDQVVSWKDDPLRARRPEAGFPEGWTD
jgi:sporulation protein YlmC with PRC-barrel domain